MNKMKRKKLMAEDEPSMTYTQKKWKTSEGILLTLLLNKDYDIWKEARLGHGSRQSHREKILIAAWVKHLLETHKKSCEFCDEPLSEHNYSKSSGIRNKTNRKLQSNAAEPVSVQRRSCSDQLHVSEEAKHVDVCDQENLELRQAENNTGDTGTPNCLEDTADVVEAASGVTDCTKLIEDEVSTAEADRKTSISVHNFVFEHSDRDNCEDEVSITMRDKCKDITSVSIKQEKQPSTAPTVNNMKKGPAQCPVCHKIFKGKDQLEWHIRRHTGNRPYKCDECQATFISPYNLKAHKKLHNPERPYCCEECGKSFQSKYVYREHLIIHSGSKPYMCTKCAKGFAARSSLAKHMVMHDAGSRDHLCVHCGKAFRHKEHLRRHVLYAHREKKESKKEHVCSICGKAFNRPYLLKIHTRVHSGERPYKCPTCGKDYKLSRQLKEHEGVHLGIKLYHCSLCGKHFQHSSTLCKHKRSCQGKDDTNKPGVHVAEKAFMMVQLETSEDGDGYVSHKESQQSLKPEPDSETDLVQSQDVNMYKGYWCSECSELYVQESAYAEHMKITHGVEAITQNQQVSLFVTAD